MTDLQRTAVVGVVRDDAIIGLRFSLRHSRRPVRGREGPLRSLKPYRSRLLLAHPPREPSETETSRHHTRSRSHVPNRDVRASRHQRTHPEALPMTRSQPFVCRRGERPAAAVPALLPRRGLAPGCVIAALAEAVGAGGWARLQGNIHRASLAGSQPPRHSLLERLVERQLGLLPVFGGRCERVRYLQPLGKLGQKGRRDHIGSRREDFTVVDRAIVAIGAKRCRIIRPRARICRSRQASTLDRVVDFGRDTRRPRRQRCSVQIATP